jgi:hypothetical protein
MHLAESIAAAVGPQPVPQRPAKHLQHPAGQQQEQMPQPTAAQQLPQPQEALSAVTETPAVTSCSTVDLLSVGKASPAELRAASPPAAAGSLQDLHHQQQEASTSVEATAAAAFCCNSMDSCHSSQEQAAPEQSDASSADLDGSVLVASLGAAPHKAAAADLQPHTHLSQQQQQQILIQLWSELQQAPKLPAATEASAEAGCRGTAAGSVGLDTPPRSLQHSSSCCSSDQAGLAAAALAAAAAATAAAPAPVAPDSPCSSVPSSGRALSSCSTSSSKKRVSWGDSVVYTLPAEEPTPLLASLWQRVCSLWTPEGDAAPYEVFGDSSTGITAAAAATTVVVVSVAAAAAVAAFVAHRVHSS